MITLKPAEGNGILPHLQVCVGSEHQFADLQVPTPNLLKFWRGELRGNGLDHEGDCTSEIVDKILEHLDHLTPFRPLLRFELHMEMQKHRPFITALWMLHGTAHRLELLKADVQDRESDRVMRA